jgi:hypothetical protein
MEYTRSASVSPSISKPPTSSPSESPSQRGSQITAGSEQSVDNAIRVGQQRKILHTATNPIISSSSGSPSGSPITASPYASPITSKPTTSEVPFFRGCSPLKCQFFKWSKNHF